MQFTIATIALAAFAVASPWGEPSSTSSAPSSSITTAPCKNGEAQLCCTSAISVLDCTLSGILGNECSNEQICCENFGSGDQTCTNSNGLSVSIPISISVPVTIL